MSIEIGTLLKKSRENLGLSIEQLQEMTKIQKSFILAIEAGEFQKLPSPFYVRTYLRSYANCVRVEPHHILRQYRKLEQAQRGLTGSHKTFAMDEAKSPKDKNEQEDYPVLTSTALTIARPLINKKGVPHGEVSQTKGVARRSMGYQCVDKSVPNFKANSVTEIATWSTPSQTNVSSVMESQEKSKLEGETIPIHLKRSRLKVKNAKNTWVWIGLVSTLGLLAILVYVMLF